jgi:phosphomethylpyrimidine synthase
MKEGIIASKIAAHAGDIAKGVKGARDWDNAMSTARVNLDWEGMFKLSIDEEKARAYREGAELEDSSTCSMCGKMCAVRTVNKTLKGEDVNILK